MGTAETLQVVFKRLLEREGVTLPWRVLLRFYHRLERVATFVVGVSSLVSPGEQFARRKRSECCVRFAARARRKFDLDECG